MWIISQHLDWPQWHLCVKSGRVKHQLNALVDIVKPEGHALYSNVSRIKSSLTLNSFDLVAQKKNQMRSIKIFNCKYKCNSRGIFVDVKHVIYSIKNRRKEISCTIFLVKNQSCTQSLVCTLKFRSKCCITPPLVNKNADLTHLSYFVNHCIREFYLMIWSGRFPLCVYSYGERTIEWKKKNPW